MKKNGRYELWVKEAGHAPHRSVSGVSLSSFKEIFEWLRSISKQVKNNEMLSSGRIKLYFVDRLTGHEIGSTLDLIDRDN